MQQSNSRAAAQQQEHKHGEAKYLHAMLFSLSASTSLNIPVLVGKKNISWYTTNYFDQNLAASTLSVYITIVHFWYLVFAKASVFCLPRLSVQKLNQPLPVHLPRLGPRDLGVVFSEMAIWTTFFLEVGFHFDAPRASFRPPTCSPLLVSVFLSLKFAV